MELTTETDAVLPCRRAGLTVSSGPEGHTVNDPVSGTVHVLNETALALWELCDGTTSPLEMAAAVDVLFAAGPGVAERDVRRTLQEFDRLGLICWLSQPGGVVDEQPC